MLEELQAGWHENQKGQESSKLRSGKFRAEKVSMLFMYSRTKRFCFWLVISKTNIMISYNLHLPAIDLTIEPQENGYYQILDGEQVLGLIYAENQGKKTNWITKDPLSTQFVNEMGALIQEHHI